MLKHRRRGQYLALMKASGWDVLLLYGDGWRKDFVRSLVDLPYAGPQALAGLSQSGDVSILLTDPWDLDAARRGAAGEFTPELTWDLDGTQSRVPGLGSQAVVAVAGLELMGVGLAGAIERAAGRALHSATREVERIRAIKAPEEVDALRRAARLADLGYECFAATAREGIAEYALAAEVEGVLKAAGAEDNFMLLASGGPEVRGMRPSSERRLARGDCVPTEITPQVDGYYAQLCRTLVVGEPSAAQRQAFDLFVRAQAAAEAMLAPGVKIADVARVQNDVFREAGLGEYTGAAYTRVRGHGLGLFVDERPQILEDVDWTVEESMVLIPHPNTYVPTAGYIVFGDALLVTGGGCERLARTEKRLFHTP
jgi:Xaa-Pro aminopeptidase